MYVHQYVAGLQRLQLQLHVGLQHDVHRASGELCRRLQVFGLYRFGDEIHRDDDVRAEVAGDVDGQVADHAAVVEDVVAEAHRGEGSGNRHAGAHGGREVAVAEHHHLARNHVGRDRAVGNGQLVEVRHVARPRDVAAQQVVDAAGVHQPGRHDHVTVLQSHVELVAVGHAAALLLDRLLFPPTHAADDLRPVDAEQEFLHALRIDAGRVATAHQRAHARAGDAVDRHVHLLQHLEHADVRAAFCAAACEHEADAGPAACGGRWCARYGGQRLAGKGRLALGLRVCGSHACAHRQDQGRRGSGRCSADHTVGNEAHVRFPAVIAVAGRESRNSWGRARRGMQSRVRATRCR